MSLIHYPVPCNSPDFCVSSPQHSIAFTYDGKTGFQKRVRHHRRRRIHRMLQKQHRGQMGRTRTRNGESGAGHELGAWRQGIFNQHGDLAIREVGKARRPAASFGQKHRQWHDNRFHRHAHHRKPHANRPDAATRRPHPELPKEIVRGETRKVFKDFKDFKVLNVPNDLKAPTKKQGTD